MDSSSTYTEQELVNGLRNRNQKIFSYLYDQYSSTLYGVVVKVLNDHASAGDVLQDVFLKIWKNIDQYDEERGRLFTWMLNICRNTAIDVLRSKAHKLDQKIQNITDDVHIGNEPLIVHMQVDHLGFSKMLERLSKDQRNLIDLAYYKGCTQEEIARVLDIPLGTVKTRMRTALNHLKQIVKNIDK
ncbi:sigma-70 family RNA polymerase sigma factor [Chitinophaga sp. CB10]|uniref:RNA polymerase sigma factor n=1 Tax=Chitinophaga sp. CB10 TaxID=1891659 RepID=UPI000B0898DA|nr:sigma-70 family RNA polymerase sigma factor [Chitinophaga sp. CB10]